MKNGQVVLDACGIVMSQDANPRRLNVLAYKETLT
jgi:hypothetical protein